MNKTFTLLGILLMLTGCAHVQAPKVVYDRSSEYITSQEVPPMENITGLAGEDFNNDFSLPKPEIKVTQPISLLPPGSLAEQQAK